MTVYILRRKKLGKSSVSGIVYHSSQGIRAFRNDGTEQTSIVNIAPGKYSSKYIYANLPESGICFRWGCTSSVPEGTKVINSAHAIQEVADKAAFRKKCADAGLAPKTSLNIHDAGGLKYPVVIRPSTHAQGKSLYVANNHQDASIKAYLCGDGYYISEFIDKVQEFRVFVYQNRVVWVAEKKPGNPNQVAWNVAQGGMFVNVKWGDWNLDVVRNALSSMALSSLDFGGVDVMVDSEGRCYTLEINSAPSQTSQYRQSCVAKAFDYSIEHTAWGNLGQTTGNSWKNYIHPGVAAKEAD